MDIQLEEDWKKVIEFCQEQIGEKPDIQGTLFLIGVRELGFGFKTYTKDEKMNIFHIALCAVLEPYGFYKFIGNDNQDWPHYENVKKLPPLDERQQQLFIKKAIVHYFQMHQIIQ